MKKLATLIGSFVCLSVMNKPKKLPQPRIINNYFIKSGGCGGSCGGRCGGCKH